MIKYFMISLIGIIVFINGYCIKKGNIGLLHLHITSQDSSSQKRSRNRKERKEIESVGNVERRGRRKRSRMAKEGITEHGYELNRNKSLQSQFIVILVIRYYLQLFNLNWG